jgi:hypothetical protein
VGDAELAIEQIGKAGIEVEERLDGPVDEQRHPDAAPMFLYLMQRADIDLEQHWNDHQPDQDGDDRPVDQNRMGHHGVEQFILCKNIVGGGPAGIAHAGSSPTIRRRGPRCARGGVQGVQKRRTVQSRSLSPVIEKIRELLVRRRGPRCARGVCKVCKSEGRFNQGRSRL